MDQTQTTETWTTYTPIDQKRNSQTIPFSKWNNIILHQRKTILVFTTMLAKESLSQLQPSSFRAPTTLTIPLIPNTSISIIPIKDTSIEGNLNLNRYSSSPSNANHQYTGIDTDNDKISIVNTPTTVT